MLPLLAAWASAADAGLSHPAPATCHNALSHSASWPQRSYQKTRQLAALARRPTPRRL